MTAASAMPKCNASILTDRPRMLGRKAIGTICVACAATTASATKEEVSVASATRMAAHSLRYFMAIAIRATTQDTWRDLARIVRLAIEVGANTHYPSAHSHYQLMVAAPSNTYTTMQPGYKECRHQRRSPSRARPAINACSTPHRGWDNSSNFRSREFWITSALLAHIPKCPACATWGVHHLRAHHLTLVTLSHQSSHLMVTTTLLWCLAKRTSTICMKMRRIRKLP